MGILSMHRRDKGNQVGVRARVCLQVRSMLLCIGPRCELHMLY